MLLKDNLERLQHLGFPATDLAISQAFYEQFGFKKTLSEKVTVGGNIVEVLFLKKDDLTLELFKQTEPMLKQGAEREDGHIDHVALNVKDIDKAYEELTAAGFVPLEDNAPVFLPLWKNGTKFFTVRGPDGEKVEFSQIL